MAQYGPKTGWKRLEGKAAPIPTNSDAPLRNDDAERVDIQLMESAEAVIHTPEHQMMPQPQKHEELPDLGVYIASAHQALGAVNDIVSKGYLEHLHKMSVLAPEKLDESNITLYKVDLMAYDKDEYATDKFVSAFTAMTFTSNTVFLIVDGHEDRTDFYIGIKNESDNSTSSISKTFENSLKGQFPGSFFHAL